jgi:hypothetical protein
MAGDPYRELPPPKRRRLIFWAALRGFLFTTVLVVLYYLLPLDRPWSADTAVRLLAGLLVFAGITAWQVRAIAGSRYPALRAGEALGLIAPLLPAAVRLDVLRDGTSLRGELHPAADPHRRPVLHGDRLLNGRFRGHHPQNRGSPDSAHRPDARRPSGPGRRHKNTPWGRAARPATTNGCRRRRRPGRYLTAAQRTQAPRGHTRRTPAGGD